MSLIAWIPLIQSEGLGDKFSRPADTTFSKNLPAAITNEYETVDGTEINRCGKIGKGYLFNNSGVRIKNIPVTKKMSFAAWIKLSSNSACHILDIRGQDNGSEKGYQPIYYNGAGIQIWSPSSNSQYINCVLGTEWHHLVVTIEDGAGGLYLDGEHKGTNSSLVGQVGISHLTIGCRCNGNNPTNGIIQDVRVYNHILSKKEIRELAKGLVCHYKLDACNNTNVIPNCLTMVDSGGTGAIAKDANTGIVYKGITKTTTTGDTDFLKWSSIITANYGDTYTVSFLGRSSDSTTIRNFLFNNITGVQASSNIASTGATSTSADGNVSITLTPEWKRYWITREFKASRDNSTAALTKTLLFRIASGVSGNAEIAEVKLEKGSKASPMGLKTSETLHSTIEPDSSGYDHKGAKYDISLYTSDTARNGSATYFNGTKSYVSFANFKPNLPNEDYTISFWINPKENGVRDIIFGNHANSTHSFNIERHTGNDLRIYYNGDTPGRLTNITMLKDEWTHIVVSRSGNTIKVWKNGECLLDKTYTLTKLTCSNPDWKIGSDYRTTETNSESTRFNGYLSDFRIYATALGEADIQELYHTSWATNKQSQMFSGSACEGWNIHQNTRSGIINCNEISETGILPMDYQPLEYIESVERACCIDTGYPINLNTDKIELDFQASDATTNYFIAGCGTSGTSAPYLWFYNYPSGARFAIYADDGSGQVGLNSGHREDANRHVVTLDCKKMYYDGVLVANALSKTFADTLGNFCLFDSCVNGSGRYSALAKIYSCKIWRNGVLARCLIAAKRKSDNQKGFYDIVTNIFYTENANKSMKEGPSSVSWGKEGNLYMGEFNEI